MIQYGTALEDNVLMNAMVWFTCYNVIGKNYTWADLPEISTGIEDMPGVHTELIGLIRLSLVQCSYV
jgi:hypothetical protein